ncbi:MAG: ABC transporter permease, partial [Candidatus Krumholzibacteria bacterium]|nr:ABC transporter permease [Candidatus Krumholzibacteria bacterium]
MIFRDLVAISTGNLRRMRLRTSLTVSGVVIAIAAFVSMVSFGAGNQKYISEQFDRLGLFTTMQVYPPVKTAGSDTVKVRTLDAGALAELARIPGVRLAYPFDA